MKVKYILLAAVGAVMATSCADLGLGVDVSSGSGSPYYYYYDNYGAGYPYYWNYWNSPVWNPGPPIAPGLPPINGGPVRPPQHNYPRPPQNQRPGMNGMPNLNGSNPGPAIIQRPGSSQGAGQIPSGSTGGSNNSRRGQN
ncbi:MAG: hypothetical protein K2J38_01340 [Muribaculaceae bacterium]|nr:hypothetical protein [Muribaculaceae bacterium]